PIHPFGAPWPPRSIQGKMLIAISESRRPRRNSVRYPVNAGLFYPASDRKPPCATGCSRAQGPSGASPARSSAHRTPDAPPPIIRHLPPAVLADCVHHVLAVRDQNIDLPQLRDDLFRLVSLPCQCSPP